MSDSDRYDPTLESEVLVKLADGRSSLELELIGEEVYDFPPQVLAELAPGESPWIEVRLRASDPGKAWECQGPWLEFGELTRLARWLSDLANGSPRYMKEWFEEPNLEFRAARKGSGWQITAYLDAECNSEGGATVGRPPDSKLDIELTPAGLAQASDQLRAELLQLRIEKAVAYHLTPVQAWDGTPAGEFFRPASLDAEGFVHLTHGSSDLVNVANAYYRYDPRPFVVLTVDLIRLSSMWRYDGDGRFPHVYGPLDRDAITEVRAIERAPDGTFLAFEPAAVDG
jgi:uncharacterized protein (DUF952 family)